MHEEGPVFFVRDEGCGFDMKFAQGLFAPFSRLHNQAEFSGSGIGLSIVIRVVTRHGGRIWTQSAPCEGSSFFFILQGWCAWTPLKQRSATPCEADCNPRRLPYS